MKQAYTNTIRRNGSGGPLVISTTKKKKKSKGSSMMPKCMYGSACTRKGCVYQHPSEDDDDEIYNKICLPYLAHLCPYGKNCRNRHPSTEEADTVRAQYKQRPCTYGNDCQTEGCLYFHSWDTIQQQPQQQQQPSLLSSNTNDPTSTTTTIVPSYEQWLEWSCPIPESYYYYNNNDDEGKNINNATDIWYRHDGSQKSCEEVYNEIYFPSYNVDYNNNGNDYYNTNVEEDDDCYNNNNNNNYVPKDCKDWIQMGCPIPQSYYDDRIRQQQQQELLLNNHQTTTNHLSMDPWYTEDGQRKTYEEVYETIYKNNDNNNNGNSPKKEISPDITDIAPTTTGWAAIAAKNIKKQPSTTNNNNNNNTVYTGTVIPNNNSTTTTIMMMNNNKGNNRDMFVRIPNELWSNNILSSNSDYFHLYPDPMERFYAVNNNHHHRQQQQQQQQQNHHRHHPQQQQPPLVLHNVPTVLGGSNKVTLLDLHYQSSKTVIVVLDSMLPLCYETFDEIWIITGSGHHTGINNNHQKKQEMGVLFNVVQSYLINNEYDYRIGKDGQGNSGALLVPGSSFYQ